MSLEYRSEKIWIVIFSVVCFVCISVLVYRLYFFQISKHEELGKYARETSVVKVVKGKRGTIYDRNGEIFAMSEPKVDVAVDPVVMKHKDDMSDILSEIVDRDKKEIRKIFDKKGHFFYIKKDINYKAAKNFKDKRDSFVNEIRNLREDKAFRKYLKIVKNGVDKNTEIPGIDIESMSKKYFRYEYLKEIIDDFRLVILIDGYKRAYPQKEMLANVLGFVRKSDDKGLEGLEMSFDDYLKGKEREVRRFRVPKKGAAAIEIEKELEDSSGYDLYTTIDSRIQLVAEEEISKMVKKTKAIWGGVVIMDPSNGQILAMANYPTFDPARYSKFSPKERRNYSVGNLFEPGSTMKIFSILAAMNEGLVKDNELFSGHNGRFNYGKRWIRDHKFIPWMTVRDIVVNSSNIGTVQIVDRLDSPKLFDYFEKFGFNGKTEVKIPGESYRPIRSYKKWYPIDKANLSFGQGLSVNMLHMVRALSTLVNGGYLWHPTIVDKIVDTSSSKIVYQKIPEPVKLNLSNDISRKMVSMLEDVVENGTGKAAGIKGVSVMGKTGTSQKYDASIRKYSWNDVVCSFLGAVPSENPKMVMMVVVDQPEGHEFGSTTAAPVFGNIAKRVLPMMGIYLESGENLSVSLPEMEMDDLSEHISENEDGTSKPFDLVPVPKFTGLKVSDAVVAANKSGLEITLVGSGEDIIKSQYPDAGDKVLYGTSVTIEIEEKGD